MEKPQVFQFPPSNVEMIILEKKSFLFSKIIFFYELMAIQHSPKLSGKIPWYLTYLSQIDSNILP